MNDIASLIEHHVNDVVVFGTPDFETTGRWQMLLLCKFLKCDRLVKTLVAPIVNAHHDSIIKWLVKCIISAAMTDVLKFMPYHYKDTYRVDYSSWIVAKMITQGVDDGVYLETDRGLIKLSKTSASIIVADMKCGICYEGSCENYTMTGNGFELPMENVLQFETARLLRDVLSNYWRRRSYDEHLDIGLYQAFGSSIEEYYENLTNKLSLN